MSNKHEPPQHNQPRNNSLDFARAVFLILMVFSHVFMNFPTDWTKFADILNILRPTTFGFAFLSGLTLAKYKSGNSNSYFYKKGIRLVIIFLILNAIRFLVEQELPSDTNFLNALLFGDQMNFSFEILFALGISTILFPLIKRAPLLIGGFMAIIIIATNIVGFFMYNFDVCLAFFVGILIANKIPNLNLKWQINVLLVLLTSLLTICTFISPAQSIITIATGIVFALLLVSIADKNMVGGFFISISQASFPLYIIHIFIIKTLTVVFANVKTQDVVALLAWGTGLTILIWIISLVIKWAIKNPTIKRVYRFVF